jgi:hypothetical protein
MYCSCPKCYAYVGIFEQVGNFSYLWVVVGECSPEFLFFCFSFCMVSFMLYLSVYLWSRCFGNLLLLAIVLRELKAIEGK